MTPVALGARTVEEALRLVRALGAHRYVAGRTHLVHALALGGLVDDAGGALTGAVAWAAAVAGDPGIDLASRDERLWRRCTEAEVAAVLAAYWSPGPRADAAREALRTLLDRHELAIGDGAPFDENGEDGMHPLLVDAGWELLGLAELDLERHKGAIAAFGDALAFASAAFEEETAVPAPVHLCELPAIGAVELLRGADAEGVLSEPLVVWVEGDETYLDYVLRGVRRAAKLADPDEGVTA
jgi:hypothetical protein